jgi:hypothetical protein
MNIEELAGFIMHLFKEEDAEAGYGMMQGKISVQVSPADQSLLPEAISLLETRGHITLIKDPENPERIPLILTQEGQEAIKRSRDL